VSSTACWAFSYVLIGAGAMVLPIGWLPQGLADDFLSGEPHGPFLDHLLQEYGAVVLALGFVFLWYASRKERSPVFFLNALIHWIRPHGPCGSWRRGIVNSIPFVALLVLGWLQSRKTAREAS
jgi:hypothetical protein